MDNKRKKNILISKLTHMTNHQFFKVEGIRVISPAFPSFHSRPEDPHKTADALNRMYNTDYTESLNNSNAVFIPPDKALHIAYTFQVPEELARAKANAITWIDQMATGTKQTLKIHLRSMLALPKLGPAQRSSITFILNHI